MKDSNKVLVIGGGGREHAIIHKLKESDKVSKIYCAPGNGGIARDAECVPIGVMEFDKLVDFAKSNEIDMVMVAPDDPLAAGAVDAFENAGIRAFGPNKRAAIIEGSKAFSKDLMKKYNIPTAKYEVFSNSVEAIGYIKEQDTYPIVVKADGLALGKGVIIAETFEERRKSGSRNYGRQGVRFCRRQSRYRGVPHGPRNIGFSVYGRKNHKTYGFRPRPQKSF